MRPAGERRPCAKELLTEGRLRSFVYDFPLLVEERGLGAGYVGGKTEGPCVTYVPPVHSTQQHMTAEHEEIQRAQRDAQAFAPLYERYFADVFRFVYRRAGQRELTADLTQQTFLKAMLALPGYRPTGSPFRAWLFRIALNELRMHWRKRKEVVMELTFMEVKGLREGIGLEETDDDIRKLSVALSRLAPEKARLIELRYMDGLSFLEVGHVLGIGEDAAKMRTHRVLHTLRSEIGPRT